jgi:hypothetical protein
MKRETKESVTPVPWDNMPRQPEPNSRLPHAALRRGAFRGIADPTFSSGQVFHPFPAILAEAEEEK